jgi:cell division protease FtsH
LRNFIIWLVVTLGLVTLFAVFQEPTQYNSRQRQAPQDIAFSQLLNDIDQGKVREVVVEGSEIHGTYKDGGAFNTYAPNDPDSIQQLYGKGISVKVRSTGGFTSILMNWLPFIVLVGVWIFLSRQMRNAGKAVFGKRADNPKHWRDRADEARIVAAELADPDSKQRMLGIAESYECLARRAELQSSERPR